MGYDVRVDIVVLISGNIFLSETRNSFSDVTVLPVRRANKSVLFFLFRTVFFRRIATIGRSVTKDQSVSPVSGAW